VLHERRIGHSGTLDPMATGLLVVFVGRATRAVEFAEAHDKRYIAGLKLGTRTDTQDVTGEILENSEKRPDKEELENVLKEFTGPIEQIPPMYSAIKVNGQRLYDLARQGKEVERKARQITIHGIELISYDGENAVLDVRCSKGTYIRTLCNDIGEALGCHGCMSSLRRIEAGAYRVENAYTLEQIKSMAAENRVEEHLLTVDSMFPEYSECTVNEGLEQKLRNGNELKIALPDGNYRVYGTTGEFLCIAAVTDKRLTTIKSFFEVKT